MARDVLNAGVAEDGVLGSMTPGNHWEKAHIMVCTCPGAVATSQELQESTRRVNAKPCRQGHVPSSNGRGVLYTLTWETIDFEVSLNAGAVVLRLGAETVLSHFFQWSRSAAHVITATIRFPWPGLLAQWTRKNAMPQNTGLRSLLR